MTLRVNRTRSSRDSYLARLLDCGIAAHPGHVAPDSVIIERPVGVERLPGFQEGVVSVQDEAPQLAAGLMQLEPGMRVLDVCAAPGGKTVHLIETCPDLAAVVALDVSADRAALIRDNLNRCGATAEVVIADAGDHSGWWNNEAFDRILLDAPCSATGVVRRHPDIKLLRQPDDIAQAATQQRRILRSVWNTLRVGGRLLYATCSILREENELNIEWFLQHQSDAREVALPQISNQAVARGVQILPGDRGMDGFYYACLTKTG
jgi:16S rRNA (cytosine967-C5)-methyltransferase